MKRKRKLRKSKRYEKLVKKLKKHPEVTNPWALAHYILEPANVKKVLRR